MGAVLRDENGGVILWPGPFTLSSTYYSLGSQPNQSSTVLCLSKTKMSLPFFPCFLFVSMIVPH